MSTRTVKHIMNTTFRFARTGMLALMILSSIARIHAQTTWSNNAGGDWNTPGNWNAGIVPGVGTNTFLTNLVAAYTVTYSAPMSAASIAALSLTNNTANAAVLNINAGGFNVSGNISDRAGGKLMVGSGGVLNSGSATVSGSGNLTVTAGGIMTNSGTLGIGNVAPGTGAVTNNASTLVTGGVTIGASADGGPLVLLGNNISSLGNLSIGRCGGAASTLPPTSSGMIISNGVVNFASIVLGAANSWGNLTMAGGVMTNSGDFILARQTSTTRGGRVTQFGGTMVSTSPNGIRMNVNNPSQISAFAVQGGTNIAEGYVLGDSTVTSGTVNFTNAGTIVVGLLGIASGNSGTTLNVALNNGGRFYSKSDWTGAVPMTLAVGGTFTFIAEDLDGTPHNITQSSSLRGSGNVVKSGAGLMLLDAVNTNSGSTMVQSGTLAIGVNGSLSNSTAIVVGSAGVLDVSAVTGGFFLNAGQSLIGSGIVTGLVTATTSTTIDPGTNTGNIASCTLTFSNGLTETGGVINKFHLTDNPLGASNDLVNVVGDLNIIGSNTVTVVGSLASGTVYSLIKYSGTFSGDISKFTLVGATGIVSNNAAGKEIVLETLVVNRGPATITWVGNPANTNWDTATSTNWLNAGVLDKFLPADATVFDNTGAANGPVNLIGSLAPASIKVDSTADYVFAGAGSIDSGSLLKTNSGKLTILTTNTYTGVTAIEGGTLEVAQLASGVNPSALGGGTTDPTKLLLNNATLRYAGSSTTTDRGMTLGSTNSAIDVTSSTLTVSSSILGTGSLTKAGAGTLILSAANTYSGSTTLSNGVLQVNTTASALAPGAVNFYGGALTLNVSGQQTFSNPLNVNTTGTINSQGGGNNIVQGTWSGTGILTVNVGTSTFSVNNPISPEFTGSIVISDTSSGVFRFNAGGNGSGAQQCNGSTNVLFDLGNGTVTLLNRNGGSNTFGYYNLGALTGGSGTKIRGASNGGSSINASYYSIGAKGLATTFAGSIQNGTGGAGATSGLIKVGANTFTLTGDNTYTGYTIVSNGVLALAFNGATDGALSGSVRITINPGTFIDVSGRSDGTLPLGGTQTLMGNGTLLGKLDTTGGGTVAPGESIGTLTVTNSVLLGGNALMEINRAASPKADKLVSQTSITYGGTLTVVNTGAALQVGDTFTLFAAPIGTLTGSFTTLALPNYTTWDTSNLTVDGSITVTGFSPAPSLTADFSGLSGGSILLSSTGGAVGGPVSILTSTNAALPLSQWTLVSSGNFDGGGNFNVSVAADPNAPQQYYILTAQ